MEENVTLGKALEMLLKVTATLPTEMITLAEADGRISARDVLAAQNIPEAARSAVDGYALHGCNLSRPEGMSVKGRLRAGEIPHWPLFPGETEAVVTGSVLPEHTGAVVPMEMVDIKNSRLVVRSESVQAGENIRPAGEDFLAGEGLAHRGTRLTPGLIGALAAFGIDDVAVFRRPRVAVLSLGREIVPHQVVPLSGQVRDCNGPLLRSLIGEQGGLVLAVQTAGGLAEGDAVEDCLSRLLQQTDLLLVIGGGAHGPDDRTYQILRSLGARILYWGMRIKPGSHSGAACPEGKLIIALSGNPTACAVGYHLLVAPVLRLMQCLTPDLLRMTATCQTPIHKQATVQRYLLGYAVSSRGGWQVTASALQKSSMLKPLLSYNCLIELQAGQKYLQEGDQVTIIFTRE